MGEDAALGGDLILLDDLVEQPHELRHRADAVGGGLMPMQASPQPNVSPSTMEKLMPSGSSVGGSVGSGGQVARRGRSYCGSG